LPARLPALLIPIKVPDNDADRADHFPGTENEARYIIPLPPALPHTATRQDLRHENQMLRETLRLAEVQLEKDFTQMKLMDSENGRLRKRAYAKEKRKAGKRETTLAHARLMTGAENLDALAENDFRKLWKEVAKEMRPIFKRRQKNIADHYRKIADERKKAAKVQKAQERAAKKAAGAAEKARKQAAAREEAVTTRGRGRGGRQGRGGAGRGRGRGRGRGKGRGARDIDSEQASEEEDLEGSSSSTENEGENEYPESSDADTTGDDEHLGDAYNEASVDIPKLPVQQRIHSRPRPRPNYRIPAPIRDEAEVVAVQADDREPQLQMGGTPTVNETSGEAGAMIEGEIGGGNGRRYPKRSNRSNRHFSVGVDA
jgi:hypothetical protein